MIDTHRPERCRATLALFVTEVLGATVVAPLPLCAAIQPAGVQADRRESAGIRRRHRIGAVRRGRTRLSSR
jgi:hypothetical protein